MNEGVGQALSVLGLAIVTVFICTTYVLLMQGGTLRAQGGLKDETKIPSITQIYGGRSDRYDFKTDGVDY